MTRPPRPPSAGLSPAGLSPAGPSASGPSAGGESPRPGPAAPPPAGASGEPGDLLEYHKVEGEYGADQLEHLSDLEHVRQRPAMYIGDISTRGLHHLVYEVVDNSIDEAMAGYATPSRSRSTTTAR